MTSIHPKRLFERSGNESAAECDFLRAAYIVGHRGLSIYLYVSEKIARDQWATTYTEAEECEQANGNRYADLDVGVALVTDHALLKGVAMLSFVRHLVGASETCYHSK